MLRSSSCRTPSLLFLPVSYKLDLLLHRSSGKSPSHRTMSPLHHRRATSSRCAIPRFDQVPTTYRLTFLPPQLPQASREYLALRPQVDDNLLACIGSRPIEATLLDNDDEYAQALYSPLGVEASGSRQPTSADEERSNSRRAARQRRRACLAPPDLIPSSSDRPASWHASAAISLPNSCQPSSTFLLLLTAP